MYLHIITFIKIPTRKMKSQHSKIKPYQNQNTMGKSSTESAAEKKSFNL